MERERADRIQLGKDAYRNGDYRLALKHFTAVIEQNDGYADVFHLMGVIFHSMGDLLAARGAFDRALAINPQFEEARINYFILLNELGEKELAERWKPAVSGADGWNGLPKNVRGRLANLRREIAQLYLQCNQGEAAVEEFTKALELAPHYHDIRLLYGNCLRVLERYEAAAAEYRRILDQKPDYHPARVFLGLCDYLTNVPDRARKEWEQVLAAEPENALAKLYLSKLNPAP